MPIRSSGKLLLALGASAIAAVHPAAALAQDGPYAPVVLMLPTGPRTLAMGNVGIGSRDDEVLFFNPAQLAVARGMSASGERYSATAAGGALSAVTRLAGGGVAIGMRMADYRVGFSGFPTDRALMLASGQDAATSLEAVAGIAQVFKGVRVGAAAKYAEAVATTERVHHAAVDLGVSRDFMRYLTAGVAVQNLGSSSSFPNARLPLRTTAGVAGSGPVGPLDITATAAVSLLRDSFVVPAGGGELSYSWLDGYAVAIRAGLRRPIAGEAPFTAGAGFTMDRLSIDYAVEALRGARAGHRIGLRIR